jgi:hypothetical protein
MNLNVGRVEEAVEQVATPGKTEVGASRLVEFNRFRTNFCPQ